MPRPGPRPYECVRRAWHSDRHQPIRGSFIQEIFRVVNEIHAPATRKNKEWQDKLPVVVLKVEEIMYSKANSEAEYMDLNTLRERSTDAINTIIRLDESTETGVSLRPCIEAALILGCTPRRATRSQRNSTPSYYLNTTGAEPTFPPSNLQKGILGPQNTVSPFVSDYSKIFTTNNTNSTNPCLKSLAPVVLENDWMNRKSSLPLESNPAVALTPSIYPLYYGPEPRYKDSKTGVEKPFESDCCQEGPAHVDCIQDISACCRDGRNKITKADCGTAFENSPEIGCDLSLRLGPCMDPRSSINNKWPQGVEGFGSHKSRGCKLRNLDPQLDKVFSFFHSDTADNNSLNASPSNWGLESGRLNADATVKKRKGVVNHRYEDIQISCKAKLPLYHHAGQIRSADPSKANSKDPAFCVNNIQSQPARSPRLFSIL